jgi:hypothetical protein
MDMHTGEALIFDACCFYAHNECKPHSYPRLVRLQICQTKAPFGNLRYWFFPSVVDPSSQY